MASVRSPHASQASESVPEDSPTNLEQSPVPPALVVSWLSDLTGRSREDAGRRLLAECGLIGHNVRAAAREFGLQPHVWNDRLMEFYASTDAFLFETAAWNACRWKIRMRAFVCEVLAARLPTQARVLCFGDGMGFESAAIAGRGLRPTCFEVSGPCLDFARRLFQHQQVDVPIVTDTSEFADGSFDAVVCLDVLEHVPDPPAVVKSFANWLRPGGLLIAHAPFYHVDATRPTHLASNRQFAGAVSGLYGPSSFRVVAVGGRLLDPLVMVKTTGGEAAAANWLTRIRIGVGQTQAFVARFLPGVPGFVAKLVARPDAQWSGQLRRLVGGEVSTS